jgi:DNA-binding MarR family transcriptional regulator
MAAATPLRGTRLTLADALREQAQSASEIGRALGKPTGSIFGVLSRMVREGLVIADTGAPQRGTLYSLAPATRTLLAELDAQTPQPGLIADGGHLLIVQQPDSMIELQRALASADAEHIKWAVETGDGGWLLSIDSDESYPVQRLRMRLEAAGAKTREIHALSVLSGQELLTRAEWLIEDMETSS